MSKLFDRDGQPMRMFNAARVSDRTVDELIGLSKGIIADGVVNDCEAAMLVNWLQQNYELASDSFVVQQLARRISVILEDGIIDADERVELFDVLACITGNSSGETLSTSLPLNYPAPSVDFPERMFCLTGKFASGTRKFCQGLVSDLGGSAHKDVTLKTNYLVIGEIGSRDWIHSSYGRKIEKAVQYRDSSKSEIVILSEEYWAECVRMHMKG